MSDDQKKDKENRQRKRRIGEVSVKNERKKGQTKKIKLKKTIR